MRTVTSCEYHLNGDDLKDALADFVLKKLGRNIKKDSIEINLPHEMGPVPDDIVRDLDAYGIVVVAHA